MSEPPSRKKQRRSVPTAPTTKDLPNKLHMLLDANAEKLEAMGLKKPWDVLYFYSKSKKAAPGKGSNEQATREYPELPLHFRQVLSNFWPSEVKMQGHTFPTVEHAFQASKFGEMKGALAFFSTGDRSGLDTTAKPRDGPTRDGLTARKNRKLYLLTAQQLADARKPGTMRELLVQKYSKPECAKVLRDTWPAVLLHGTRGVPMHIQWDLMHVRASLGNDPSKQA